jgi:hypothetical protein
MAPRFTLNEARDLLPTLREHAERIVRLRADLADASAALRTGSEPAGGIPEVKALEAHLQEAIDWFTAQGIELKGIAPLIVDLPSELDGKKVLLCWLEGETSLGWYHTAETGFVGRRRLPDDM